MLKRYLSHFVWIIRKKPIYSVVTLFGFTIGITASLLIYLWVYDELSFEKMHDDSNRIYRVLTLKKQGQEIIKTPFSVIPLAGTLIKDFPQIESATFINYGSMMPLQLGEKKIEIIPAYTDRNFFKIFNGFEFLEGDPESALNQPNAIILSHEIAKKFFGDEPAIGKSLVSNNFGKLKYVIGGVIKIPDQTHFDFGMITLMEYNRFLLSNFKSNWQRGGWTSVYMKLRKNVEIDESVKNQLSDLITKYSNRSDRLTFQPIGDIHLNSDYTYRFDKNQGDKKYLWIFSGMAVIILLMAAFNFTALTTARSSERAIEIGMWKTVGASKARIGRMIVGETIFQTMIAMAMAILLVSLLLPWFNDLAGKSISWSLSPSLIASLLGIALTVGIISAIYPAMYLTSFNPVQIFKGGSPSGSRAHFISVIVVVQFIAACFMISATGIVIKQLSYIKNKDIGLDKENVLVIPTGLWYSIDAYKTELKKNPNILSVSASTSMPQEDSYKITIGWTGMNSADSINMRNVWVDQDFAETYNLEMHSGDFLRYSYSDYWKGLEQGSEANKKGKSHTYSVPVVINERAQELMGLDDPIGKRLNNYYTIIGVVKDFHARSLHHKIEPLLIHYSPESIISMSIKIADENRSETIRFIEDKWIKFRGNRGFSYTFFEDQLALKYQYENQLVRIVLYFSILAIIIALLGVLGLATYAAERRTKEIGIRKINGSTIWEVMVWLNLDFLKWVVIGFALACPAAIYFSQKWLESFAYRTTGNWWVYVSAGIISLLLALLTVSWQSYRAAIKNPVDALRSD